jgi:hypothetical protein
MNPPTSRTTHTTRSPEPTTRNFLFSPADRVDPAGRAPNGPRLILPLNSGYSSDASPNRPRTPKTGAKTVVKMLTHGPPRSCAVQVGQLLTCGAVWAQCWRGPLPTRALDRLVGYAAHRSRVEPVDQLCLVGARLLFRAYRHFCQLQAQHRHLCNKPVTMRSVEASALIVSATSGPTRSESPRTRSCRRLSVYPHAGACARDTHLSGDVGDGTCLAPLHEPPTPLDAQGRMRVGHSSSSRRQTTAGATPTVRACRIAAFQPRGATRIRFPSGSAARKVRPNPAS